MTLKTLLPASAALLGSALFAEDSSEQNPVFYLQLEDFSSSQLPAVLLESDPGELVIESSASLGPESWTEFGRFASLDREQILSARYPFQKNNGRFFYRVSLHAATDGFYVNGDIATQIHETIQFPAIDTLFGLGFESDDATLLAATETTSISEAANQASRNQRIYAGALATLTRTIQLMRSESPFGSQPSTDELIQQLASDIEDGSLSELTNDDPIASWEEVRGLMAGLENVELTENQDGSLAFTVPAKWDLDDWDSADWQ